MDEQDISTLAVDKETQRLIREYCFIHRVNVKWFVEKLANEKLETFKERLNELRKLKV